MKNIAVVIPARLNSTRIKHKMLMKFDDEPLIRLVFDKVRMMGYDTFVATDSKRIAKLFPIKWCIQTGKADNGTHRLSKRVVLDLVNSYDYIINIQGDEPFINPTQINQLIDSFEDEKIEIITLAKRIESEEIFFDPNKIKVKINDKKRAVSFDRIINSEFTKKFYKHIIQL